MGMYGYSMWSIILTTAHLHRTAAVGRERRRTLSVADPLRTSPWRLFAPRPGGEGGVGAFTHSGVMSREFSPPLSNATEPDW